MHALPNIRIEVHNHVHNKSTLHLFCTHKQDDTFILIPCLYCMLYKCTVYQLSYTCLAHTPSMQKGYMASAHYVCTVLCCTKCDVCYLAYTCLHTQPGFSHGPHLNKTSWAGDTLPSHFPNKKVMGRGTFDISIHPTNQRVLWLRYGDRQQGRQRMEPSGSHPTLFQNV